MLNSRYTLVKGGLRAFVYGHICFERASIRARSVRQTSPEGRCDRETTEGPTAEVYLTSVQSPFAG